MRLPRPRRAAASLIVFASAAALAGCGEDGIKVAESGPDYQAARIFEERCGACHTLDAAGTQGSATNVNDREYKDGPNFNQRKEKKVSDVLYAIRNGGFSAGPMPQNIVVGREAEEVARFVVKYSGGKSAGDAQSGNPGNTPGTDSGQ